MLNGTVLQLYYPTEKQAQDMVDKAAEFNAMKRPIWSKNNTKRRDAKYNDLPVGLLQSHDTKCNVSGVPIRRDYIKCTFIWNKKPKSILRFFGRRRTREQAIYEVIKSTLKFFRENKEAEFSVNE